MRVILVLCSIAVAAAQYQYAANSIPQTGAAQFSQPVQPVNEYNKEFYTYSAPENEFDDAGANDHIANSLKKNLRVIFIKGPENTGLENAALQLAKSAGDDRTAIYVLSKQADIGDLANKLSGVQGNTHQPEVHFVKYRTPADAENAQRAIQSQYDSLPGATSNHNAGSAPVLDFASRAAPAAQQVQSAGGVAANPQGVQAAPANTYIPPQQQQQQQQQQQHQHQHQPQPQHQQQTQTQHQPQTYLPPGRKF